MTGWLLGSPRSHPVLAAELMLRHRAVDYRRMKLGGTGPLLYSDGARIKGAKAIARRLGFLASPEEDWADEVLGDWLRSPAAERLETAGRHLDRIDAWIARGILGREEPTAADFQVAACVRCALRHDDLRPLIEDRPAEQLARRLAPDH